MRKSVNNIGEKIEKEYNLSKNISLLIEGKCRFFVLVETFEELTDALNWARDNSLSISLLGKGTNITIPEYLDALVIKIDIKDIEVDGSKVVATCGVEFDKLVEYSLENSLYGLENLSGIPGTVGASVIQNIGAYGVEVSEYVREVEYLDLNTFKIKIASNKECEFIYRSSKFSKEEVVVLKVVFALKDKFEPVTKYKDIKNMTFTKGNDLREKIIEIRKEKFAEVHSAGSFFKNIELDSESLKEFKNKYENVPVYEVESGYKIPTAWLMDKVCGLNGYSKNGLKLKENNPIVLITEKCVSASDLWSFVDDIRVKVKGISGIDLKNEVYELPIIKL